MKNLSTSDLAGATVKSRLSKAFTVLSSFELSANPASSWADSQRDRGAPALILKARSEAAVAIRDATLTSTESLVGSPDFTSEYQTALEVSSKNVRSKPFFVLRSSLLK
ncbi:hypothetical protein [Parafrigoribacterium mesophilum]|uniref:hypothetical protein n=1 Tax=Parafrigoribacterium mesophilum TaxID=433646 RepID=UPI0031FBA46C